MGKRITAKSAFIASLTVVLTGCTLSPERITQGDRAERIAQDKADMFACQECVRGTITLSEALARALKYNLDLRLKTADSYLAYSEYGVTKYDMLPDFVSHGGFLSRSNIHAVRQSPDSQFTSYSQDRHRHVADLQLSWNILDFGVSYIQAKQKGDQYLISRERRRKIEQDIVRDVRYAYFRAVTAQKAIREMDPLISDVNAALARSRNLETNQTQSPIESLRYQKTLLATLRQLSTLRKELNDARRELGALMNVPPGQPFELLESINTEEVLPRGFPLRMERLEYIALQNRPEIREEDYRTRISANEITKAKLRLFPGLELTAGLNYDSNRFLVHNIWANHGAQLVWSLMKVFSAPANIQHAKNQLLVTNVRRMALSMAVLTQVDVALIRYTEVRKELEVATKSHAVTARISKTIEEGFLAKKNTEMQFIQAKADALLSKLRYNLTYAEWQNAAGQLLSSVGYDVIYDVDTTQSIAMLEQKLNVALNTEPAWSMYHRMPGVYARETYTNTNVIALDDKRILPVKIESVKQAASQHNQPIKQTPEITSANTSVNVQNTQNAVSPSAPTPRVVPANTDTLVELPHPDITVHPVDQKVNSNSPSPRVNSDLKNGSQDRPNRIENSVEQKSSSQVQPQQQPLQQPQVQLPTPSLHSKSVQAMVVDKIAPNSCVKSEHSSQMQCASQNVSSVDQVKDVPITEKSLQTTLTAEPVKIAPLVPSMITKTTPAAITAPVSEPINVVTTAESANASASAQSVNDTLITEPSKTQPGEQSTAASVTDSVNSTSVAKPQESSSVDVRVRNSSTQSSSTDILVKTRMTMTAPVIKQEIQDQARLMAQHSHEQFKSVKKFDSAELLVVSKPQMIAKTIEPDQKAPQSTSVHQQEAACENQVGQYQKISCNRHSVRSRHQQMIERQHAQSKETTLTNHTVNTLPPALAEVAVPSLDSQSITDVVTSVELPIPTDVHLSQHHQEMQKNIIQHLHQQGAIVSKPQVAAQSEDTKQEITKQKPSNKKLHELKHHANLSEAFGFNKSHQSDAIKQAKQPTQLPSKMEFQLDSSDNDVTDDEDTI